MKTIAQKMKTHAMNINVVNNNLERQVLNLLLWTLGALAVCYLFFLGSMVLNVVERRSLETGANVLANQVQDLELEYLSVSNKIDLTFAKSLGFQETKTKFATRSFLGSLKLAKNDL
ncbi:MAG: hypothetical protein WAV23_02455 [Minisyncoccia bacterium]